MHPNNSLPPVLVRTLKVLDDEKRRQLERSTALGSDCLGIPRAHDLAFAPSQATPEEHAHLTRCDWCQRLVSKIRDAEHPALALIYAGQWGQLPSIDQAVVAGHVEGCRRCGLLASVAGFLPPHWHESVFRRLTAAVDFGFVQPPAVGLQRVGARQSGVNEVVTFGVWVVTVEEQGSDLQLVVNRRGDGEPHRLARAAMIGPDRAIIIDVPLTQAGEWWTGNMQVVNPWADRVEAVDLSIVVTESEA